MNEFVYTPKPITLVDGDDVTLVDETGNAYLDAGASYGCVPVGHANRTVADAVAAQANAWSFAHGSYHTPSRTNLLDRLGSIVPEGLTSVWLCNSGTEANEAALKFARSATGRSQFVAAVGGFHGRTMGSLSVTWKSKYRKPYEPLLADVTFVPYGDGDALADAVDDDVAGVILEPILGEAGIVEPGMDYLGAARDLTEEAGSALIFDEIQTGLGRTGAWWAGPDCGVTPDVMTMAKGLANGVPIGATVCASWIADGAASHGSTYAGNPIATAAATATLEVLVEDDLVANAHDIGQYLRDELVAALGEAFEIRGRGCMIGIDTRRPVGPILRSLALDEHVLALPAGRRVIRLLPPLTLSRDGADRIVEAIGATVGDTEASDGS